MINIRSIIKLWLFYTAIFTLSSCKDDLPSKRFISEKSKRVVMLYMSANNNLAQEAYLNLNQMEEGYRHIDGKLLVYARIFGQQPKIYEIVADHSPQIVSKVLKTYPDHNASDPTIMKMVFSDMQDLASADSYAAILWSHATNWYPAAGRTIKVRSFGDDESRDMDIQDLKNALPKNLDYLIFDACSMASVEVLYELKDIVPFVLASPTEVISVGMPYQKVLPYLFKEDIKQGLQEVAQTYYNYYQAKEGLYQSATFSLVDMSYLNELAQLMKTINTNAALTNYKVEEVQRLDLDSNSPVKAYDFMDFLQHNYPTDAVYSIQKIFEKAIIYKVKTSHFLGSPIRNFSGLSCFVPTNEEKSVIDFYRILNWSKDSNFYQSF